MTKVAGRNADSLIGRISGVSPTDTKVEAAEKVIATMKLAGMSTRAAEKMLADYKRREGIA